MKRKRHPVIFGAIIGILTYYIFTIIFWLITGNEFGRVTIEFIRNIFGVH